jgi:hypothetical protein
MLVAGKPALKGTPISKNVFKGQDRKSFGNLQGGGDGNMGDAEMGLISQPSSGWLTESSQKKV